MKKLLYGFLSLNCLVLTGCQTRNDFQSLSSPTVSYTSQMEFEAGLVQVSLSLNHAKAQPFILDSGLSELLISPQQVQHSGAIESGKTVNLTGIGNQVTSVETVNNLVIGLGGVQWATGTALVLPSDLSQQVEQNTGLIFNGILGAQLFENYVVVIDFVDQQIILHPNRDYRYDGEGDILPLSFKNRKPFIQASVSLTQGMPAQTGKFLIDLGSTKALDIKQWGKVNSDLNIGTLPKRYASGLGGETQYPTGRVHELKIGSQTIPAPITTFEDDAQTPLSTELTGRIGTQILSHYRLIFNYAQKQLILERPTQTFPRLETDMSGLRLQWDQRADVPIRVAHIYPNSPAAQVDIQIGDRILEIDNASITTQTLEEVKQRLIGPPESIRKLLIQRNGHNLLRSIQLKRLI
ncbi:MAG: PDZ domain-containing protein [Acaryochloridaceae cyanobacterium RL_2_7]|nr:PDZ domain-containing protein [Acaryochloridaceae cyanobacterium RL_2_7]